MAGPSETSFYQIDARDSAGVAQQFLAAYRHQQFLLFRVNEYTQRAEVLYLLPAATPADVPQVLRQRLIDVQSARLLDVEQRPLFEGVRLLLSHPWSELERGIVGVILGVPTSDVI